MENNDYPIINVDDDDFEAQLSFALWGTGSSSDYRNDRDRPYNGQPHTYQGIRGQQMVEGLTMRDIYDCLMKAFLSCSGQEDLYQKVENNTWRYDDVYKVDMEHLDPQAVGKNLTCEIEKMMEIYPNIEVSPSAQEIIEHFGTSGEK